ncbi:MAG TPA: SUMF1/EgtB/PvdO family nonheme iron enzyme [Chthoniobacterales bacterium]|nr:SUMF1/EgtB/PvdO family nonheme iron enzyme [Chthoniobacterales bacterium]
MPFVTVGDPSNKADYQTNLGKVSAVFSIGAYEVTAREYCAFLNAVARTSDPYALYHRGMSFDPHVASIKRMGTNGNYSYDPIHGCEELPVAYVSLYVAARFCNWLHNGQPEGVEDDTTTETGAYTLHGAMSGALMRNKKAKYFIPNENEWYKAAYYDAKLLSYYNFPTRSYWAPLNTHNIEEPYNLETEIEMNNLSQHTWAQDFFSEVSHTVKVCFDTCYQGLEAFKNHGLKPTSDETSSSSIPISSCNNEANYNHSELTQSDLVLTPVGTFSTSMSSYGVFDMGGNVAEWTETPYSEEKTFLNKLFSSKKIPESNFFVIRGGSWASHSNNFYQNDLQKEAHCGADPCQGSNMMGFRIAKSGASEGVPALSDLPDTVRWTPTEIEEVGAIGVGVITAITVAVLWLPALCERRAIVREEGETALGIGNEQRESLESISASQGKGNRARGARRSSIIEVSRKRRKSTLSANPTFHEQLEHDIAANDDEIKRLSKAYCSDYQNHLAEDTSESTWVTSEHVVITTATQLLEKVDQKIEHLRKAVEQSHQLKESNYATALIYQGAETEALLESIVYHARIFLDLKAASSESLKTNAVSWKESLAEKIKNYLIYLEQYQKNINELQTVLDNKSFSSYKMKHPYLKEQLGKIEDNKMVFEKFVENSVISQYGDPLDFISIYLNSYFSLCTKQANNLENYISIWEQYANTRDLAPVYQKLAEQTRERAANLQSVFKKEEPLFVPDVSLSPEDVERLFK